MSEIVLSGCYSTPLASYLKALGVFRLVAGQADPEAKGFWRDDQFILVSRLSREDLLRFFLDEYSPSMAANPWGGRSGFYAESSEKSAREALKKILARDEPRFVMFRDTTKAVQELLQKLGFKQKPKTEAEKNKLLNACRSTLPEAILEWLDAVVVLTNSNRVFPPLLGTGGNEGSGSYTSGYTQSVAEALLGKKSRSAVEASLFGTAGPGILSSSQTPGQFDPGRTGGANQGHGIEAKTKTNPWDMILTIEGAFLFAGSATRKYAHFQSGQASFPFMVRASTVGYTSAASGDGAKAREELWLPLWRYPSSFKEIRELFAEGRAQVRQRQARNGVEFLRAIGRLGVDRGISAFNRVMLLERRGKGYYIALPAGQHPVRELPELNLLDELDPLLYRLDTFLRRFKNAPATLSTARRLVDEAIYQICLKPGPQSFSTLVRALGGVERLIAQRDRSKDPRLAKPLGGLSCRWIEAADDGTPELRIAAALASIARTGKVGPIRSNLAGVDAGSPWKWAEGNGQKHWHGVNLPERLAGVLKQRMMDAGRLGTEKLPLWGRLNLHPRDIVPFLYGHCDEEHIEELLWGFTLVDWSAAEQNDLEAIRKRWGKSLSTGWPIPRSWAILKLLHSQGTVLDKTVRSEPRIVYLLQAGRAGEAVELARHRLAVSELKPLPVEPDSSLAPAMLCAGLLLPVFPLSILESLAVIKPKPVSERIGYNA